MLVSKVDCTHPCQDQTMVVLQDNVVSITHADFVERGVEIMRWIYEQMGRNDEVWQYYTAFDRAFFAFAQRSDAVLFKLAWGNGSH